jgi:hypothetical protein
MTMNVIQPLTDQAAESLSGGTGCPPRPDHCMPKFPSFPCMAAITLPEISIPDISIPDISIPHISLHWGSCKPSRPKSC